MFNNLRQCSTKFPPLHIKPFFNCSISYEKRRIPSNNCDKLKQPKTNCKFWNRTLSYLKLRNWYHSIKKAMNIVERHGRTWRYTFNAKKSAVMVFGESSAEAARGSANRMFKLGHDRVKECQYYDHVGIKVSVKGDSHVRTEEKVKKARTALNMATCMGIRKGGLNMLTCCIIFWSVVVPTLCFGCELWVLSVKDVQILQSFQRYAARRIQRFHSRSLNATSRVCLGWIDIIRLIMVKKLFF